MNQEKELTNHSSSMRDLQPLIGPSWWFCDASSSCEQWRKPLATLYWIHDCVYIYIYTYIPWLQELLGSIFANPPSNYEQNRICLVPFFSRSLTLIMTTTSRSPLLEEMIQLDYSNFFQMGCFNYQLEWSFLGEVISAICSAMPSFRLPWWASVSRMDLQGPIHGRK